jgi:predicted transcriptional regulator
MSTRFTMDVGPEFDDKLSELSSRAGTSKAEIIKRAVASYAYLKDETRNGNRVAITERESGVVLKDVILP